MTNFEKMKQYLIAEISKQINQMNEEDFVEFTYVLSGDCMLKKDSVKFDLSGIFSCKDCSEYYGKSKRS